MTDAEISAMRDDVAAAIERLRAIEARLGGQGGDAVVAAATVPPEDQWPPDPATIDLHDDGSWVSVKAAAHLADNAPVTIYRRIASENIAIQIGGTWWVNRARLLSGRRYPKAPDDEI